MKRDLLRIVQEHQAMEGIANEIAHHHPSCRLV